jgi:hypothetical protein
MQNKLKNLFVMMTLTVMLVSLVSVSAQAGPPDFIKVGPFTETYDDACCNALLWYVACEDSDPQYKEGFKRECAYLGAKIRLYSMDDLDALEDTNCTSSEREETQRSVICNMRVD